MAIETNVYTSLWRKYKPALVHLMKASSEVPQQYKLSDHEFKALGKRDKSGHAFNIEVFNGKSINSLNGSSVARDLIYVLRESKTAMALLSETPYEFKMDKQFMLNITKKEKVEALPA